MANEFATLATFAKQLIKEQTDRVGVGRRRGGRRRGSSEGGRGRVGRTGGSGNQLIKYGSRQTEWAGEGVKVLT
jgi:hypothetical protein